MSRKEQNVDANGSWSEGKEDMERACRLATGMRSRAKESVKKFAKNGNMVLPRRISTKVIKAIGKGEFDWQEAEASEAESPGSEYSMPESDREVTPVNEESWDESASNAQENSSGGEAAASTSRAVSTAEHGKKGGRFVFGAKDDHPLKLGGSGNSEKRQKKLDWYRDMRARLMEDKNMIWQTLARDDGSALAKGISRVATPCAGYNNTGCHDQRCKKEHICIACKSIFSVLKIHAYGPMCPIFKYRKSIY